MRYLALSTRDYRLGFRFGPFVYEPTRRRRRAKMVFLGREEQKVHVMMVSFVSLHRKEHEVTLEFAFHVTRFASRRSKVPSILATKKATEVSTGPSYIRQKVPVESE